MTRLQDNPENCLADFNELKESAGSSHLFMKVLKLYKLHPGPLRVLV